MHVLTLTSSLEPLHDQVSIALQSLEAFSQSVAVDRILCTPWGLPGTCAGQQYLKIILKNRFARYSSAISACEKGKAWKSAVLQASHGTRLFTLAPSSSGTGPTSTFLDFHFVAIYYKFSCNGSS